MKHILTRFSALISSIFICLSNNPGMAQIMPDTTLTNNTTITPNGIEGGQQIGGNLFHSFQEFSVLTNQTVHFNNNIDIQNIITRITGNKTSNIDGTISANGNANLFLINPNGISFGPNAQLAIAGSFLASTGNSIKFSDGSFYSATNPQNPPLLTVNVPIGIQTGENPGKIEVNGAKMQVLPGQSIALIGGDLVMNGAGINTFSGRIELGSLGNNSLVNLSQTTSGLTLDYTGVNNFKNITLDQGTSIQNMGFGNNNITLQGNQINIDNGSKLAAITLGTGGQNSNININGNDVIIDQGLINSAIVGEGKGANININAPESLTVKGKGYDNLARITYLAFTQQLQVQDLDTGIINATLAQGTAGDTFLNTKKLSVSDGSLILIPAFSVGNSGNMKIKADTINVDASIITTNTLSSGKGGNIDIDTRTFSVVNQSQVSTTTFSSGNAGSLTVNASESVDLIAGDLPSLYRNGLSASAYFNSSGSGNNLIVKTPKLTVSKGSTMTVGVGTLGTGNSGDLTIDVGLFISDNGLIFANSVIGAGGNINLNVSQALIMRNQNQISTQSGIEESGGGNGGNMNINAATIVGIENSIISANAFAGKGGNIKINTQGIFLSPDSKITASSQLGVNGVIEINQPGIDPNSGLVKLSENVADISNQINTGCAADKGNTFVITGRGGLPEDPSGIIRDKVVWRDLRPLSNSMINMEKVSLSNNYPVFIEANKLLIKDKNQVILVADYHQDNGENYWQKLANCSSNK